ncbi:hypothetical protein P8452_05399 [Trifolium repens]|nr:hypothetical protein P8452_05391 [Trifolium repens]WJX15228.1 hypothetical protein P8452_05399 [Trifolium repens]
MGKDFALPPPKKLKGEEVNSSVPMSQDYVENDPPPKELEVEEDEDHWYIPIPQDSVENEEELEGEEDNSSVPISQDSDREAREAFNRWRQLFEVNYTLTTEEERRFKYFKNYFNRKVDPVMEMFGINLPEFADRNKQEFNALTFHGNLVYGNLVYCSVSLESLDQWEEIRARFP